jgi:hypothetical protein
VVEQPTKRFYIGRQNGVDADGKVVGPRPWPRWHRRE